MTISSEVRKAGPFNGNDLTTSFPFTFKVFDKGDLRVVRTMPSGIEADLVLDSDYSVTLNGDQDANPGGTITYPVSGAPLPGGWRLTAVGDLGNLQPTDLTNGGGFYPQVIENMSDRLTMLIQQLEEELGRTIRIAVSDDVTDGLELPAQDGRAARILGFDADGNFTTYERATATVQTTYRQFTATAGQTSFTLPNTYTPGANSLYVWLNGAKLISGTDFTETTSTSFTLTVGATAGDVIEAIAGVPIANGTVADSSQVSYTPAGAGAVARTAQAKMRDIVSVKDFGAKGDGVTDDAAAINAAIVYANSKGGGTVFFPSGTYRVKSSVQYLAGADLIGESMGNTTLKWHPDTNTAGTILNTSNQYLNRARFENLRFTKDASITANTTGILGGSTLEKYNSAVACFENLHFDGLTYGIRGDAEPTGVGLFDCYFKNIWCSGCFYGLWLFGSSNRVDHPRMTSCDTAIALDYLNAESYDGMTVTGGTFVQNNYDVGVLSASGIRPVKFIGTWHETSAAGIINVVNAGSRVMNLDFIGCMLSTSSTVSLFNVANAVGTVSIDRCTLISGGLIGGTPASQTIIRPTAAGGRLLVNACQKYDSAGVASFVSDSNYFEAVKSGVNQSIPSAAYTKLTWAAATIDSAPGFDNANDTYVIPVKGVYRVVASIAFNPHSVSTNQNQVLMYQNGSFRRTAIGASNSSAATTVTLDCLFAFNAGDTVDIRVFHGNGTAIDVLGADDLTRFSVQFVSPQ